MSYWEDPKPVQRTRAVDIAALAQASADLLDEGGIPAVTVRAVAARIGVAAPSLYSRVRTVDDLHDVALDAVLGADAQLQAAQQSASAAADGEAAESLRMLLIAFFRHLRSHPWAGQVIALRAPRGPHYLALSEVLCVLLERAGAADPLGASYALSNFVIGSALTASMAAGEKQAPVDAAQAPVYARLHAAHAVDPEAILTAGLDALLPALTHQP